LEEEEEGRMVTEGSLPSGLRYQAALRAEARGTGFRHRYTICARGGTLCPWHLHAIT